MKNHLLSITILLVAVFFSCNSSKKSDEVANYVYEEKVNTINAEFQKKVGDWLQEDVVCYGIVVAIDKKGIRKYGKPVKAKVVTIASNEIKMKALENVNIAKSANCSKMGISRGKIWQEKDGDLFKTKEDAINYLKTNDLLIE